MLYSHKPISFAHIDYNQTKQKREMNILIVRVKMTKAFMICAALWINKAMLEFRQHTHTYTATIHQNGERPNETSFSLKLILKLLYDEIAPVSEKPTVYNSQFRLQLKYA